MRISACPSRRRPGGFGARQLPWCVHHRRETAGWQHHHHAARAQRLSNERAHLSAQDQGNPAGPACASNTNSAVKSSKSPELYLNRIFLGNLACLWRGRRSPTVLRQERQRPDHPGDGDAGGPAQGALARQPAGGCGARHRPTQLLRCADCAIFGWISKAKRIATPRCGHADAGAGAFAKPSIAMPITWRRWRATTPSRGFRRSGLYRRGSMITTTIDSRLAGRGDRRPCVQRLFRSNTSAATGYRGPEAHLEPNLSAQLSKDPEFSRPV